MHALHGQTWKVVSHKYRITYQKLCQELEIERWAEERRSVGRLARDDPALDYTGSLQNGNMT